MVVGIDRNLPPDELLLLRIQEKRREEVLTELKQYYAEDIKSLIEEISDLSAKFDSIENKLKGVHAALSHIKDMIK